MIKQLSAPCWVVEDNSGGCHLDNQAQARALADDMDVPRPERLSNPLLPDVVAVLARHHQPQETDMTADAPVESELTAEEMAVAVALARTFRRRVYDDTARQMTAALRVANWVFRPALAVEPPACPCCLGDPDTVCDACGQHPCWAGEFMCEDAATAGTRQLAASAVPSGEKPA